MSPRKKLRGRRRLLRQAQRWRTATHPLSPTQLAAHHRDYLKLWLRPWPDWFYARSPPAAIRRELLAGLLATHHQWREQLEKFGQPYYLAVWLFENEFSRSQVVAGVNDRVA